MTLADFVADLGPCAVFICVLQRENTFYVFATSVHTNHNRNGTNIFCARFRRKSPAESPHERTDSNRSCSEHTVHCAADGGCCQDEVDCCTRFLRIRFVAQSEHAPIFLERSTPGNYLIECEHCPPSALCYRKLIATCGEGLLRDARK